jgi:hypothetical protein
MKSWYCSKGLDIEKGPRSRRRNPARNVSNKQLLAVGAVNVPHYRRGSNTRPRLPWPLTPTVDTPTSPQTIARS